MKMRKVENFCKKGGNGACEALSAAKNDAQNSAYLAPQAQTSASKAAARNAAPEDEKFLLEYGESLAEGDLRPILLENYDAPK